jgi:hypothetical protein
MAQVANYQVPAHPSGLEMRTQLNQIVLALVSQATGPVAPVQTFPMMFWGDTTGGRLRQRNLANDAWIDLGPINDFLTDIRNLVQSTAALKVNRTGDYMTGELSMRAAIPMQTADGVTRFVLATDGVNNGFINGARNQWNLNVLDDGRAIFRNQVQINAGGLYSLARTTVRNADLQLQGGPNNWSMFMRYDPSGAVARMEWINDAYNSVIAWLDNGGTMFLSNLLVGSAQVSPDGNISGPIYGGWLTNWVAGQLGNRAPNGAQVQHNSGIAESAQWASGAGDNIVDMGNPWVCQGIRTMGGLGWCWLRCVWLRNA